MNFIDYSFVFYVILSVTMYLIGLFHRDESWQSRNVMC